MLPEKKKAIHVEKNVRKMKFLSLFIYMRDTKLCFTHENPKTKQFGN